MAFDDIPEDRCGKPCPAEHFCEECREYWMRMVADGMWDPIRGEWTEKAIWEAST